MDHIPVSGAGIASLATANPDLYVTQTEAFEVFDRLFGLRGEERSLYRKILCKGSIRGRYVALDETDQIARQDPDELASRFLAQGREVAGRAARRAIRQAGLQSDDIDALLVNTCTGYLCPGLSSYVAEQLGLRPDIRTLDIMGMGCGGALPNLESAVGHLACHPEHHVLSVSIEICSATIFMDPDPGLVVSNCIFADGAAAIVLARDSEALPAIEVIDFASVFYPEHRGRLQYRTENHRLRNVLDVRVPIIAARGVKAVTSRLLAKHGLLKEDIRHWAVHPGGQRVLDRINTQLGFRNGVLDCAYEVLHEYGNMSSPSVLFVLKKIVTDQRPEPGAWGLLVSFGAGFSVFAVLVRFRGAPDKLVKV